MLSRPPVLVPVLLIVGLVVVSLLSLVLPVSASWCLVLTAYALGYGLPLLGQTGHGEAQGVSSL